MKDQGIFEESIKNVMPKVRSDPLICVRVWLEVSRSSALTGAPTLLSRASKQLACRSCQLTFNSNDELTAHVESAHTYNELVLQWEEP
jgi:hypothetical protein